MIKKLLLIYFLVNLTLTLGFVVGVYASFNHTPLDYIMFPILEHFGFI